MVPHKEHLLIGWIILCTHWWMCSPVSGQFVNCNLQILAQGHERYIFFRTLSSTLSKTKRGRKCSKNLMERQLAKMFPDVLVGKLNQTVSVSWNVHSQLYFEILTRFRIFIIANLLTWQWNKNEDAGMKDASDWNTLVWKSVLSVTTKWEIHVHVHKSYKSNFLTISQTWVIM